MPFGRGNLYHLLSNQIYIGKIRHKDQVYDGEREPIVTAALFQEAQALLAAQAPRRRSHSNVSQPSADRFALSRSWREIAIGSCQQARCPLPLLCLEAIRRPTAKRVRGLAPSCAGCGIGS
ncbi:recombinase family protein [Mesorhizobium sp.]|uniref:recombinase family protein n=1 Tax=Mesorhizobium sp. TaxID=1871066 RepID=UPI00338D6BE6